MSAAVQRLIAAAKEAARNAYAPYSGYHVGAALQLDSGKIVTGANFENASYGMTLCAETVAIAKANSDGELFKITAIAIAGGPALVSMKPDIGAEAVTPCGRCRQILKEVSDLTERDLPIYCVHKNGYDSYTLSQLLPHAFGPANLE